MLRFARKRVKTIFPAIFLMLFVAAPVMAQDLDGDGLDNSVETNTGVYSSAEDTGTSPYNPDTDGDGLSDGDETLLFMTNPCDRDSDGDNLNDGDEISHGSDPFSPDTDGDGLTDGDEVDLYGTDPIKTDTDGDGAIDGQPRTSGRMILDPHPNQILPQELIYLNGVIPNYSDFSSAQVRILESGISYPLTVSGNTTNPEIGSFSRQITIAPGTNTVVLTVNYNSSGPVTETIYPVILDQSAPSVSIMNGSSNAGGALVEVRGTFTKDPWETKENIMVLINTEL